MTELYRGLLLVLTNKFNELILSFRMHIQSFKQDTSDPSNYFDVDVLGFWNLMLEIVFVLYTLICLTSGVILISILAVLFYPCHAFLRYTSLILRNIKSPPPEPVIKDNIQSTFTEKSPVIIKKDGKEKE